jgi:hypothetical protein
MDPDQTLRELRALVARILCDADVAEGSVNLDDAVTLAERFQNLDQWISRGGFLPDQWAKGGAT